jgi:drug/metabolite transporter (DMT)-like permease
VKESLQAAKTASNGRIIDLKSMFALLTLSMVWGSSFILIKRGLVVFDATQVATLRIGISALAFLPVFLYRFHRIDWGRLKYFLIVGLCGSGLPAFLFAIAQTEISSSMTGILNSLTPLFTLFIGILVFNARFVWAKLLGVMLGLVGAVLLILMSAGMAGSGNLWYALLVVLATICYATSVNTVGAYLKDLSSVTISSVSFVLFGGPALIYLFSTDFIPLMQQGAESWLALGYVSILAVLGTVLASILFFKLVQWTTPLYSSTVAYLIPIIALGWGLVDGEMIGWGHLIGMTLILSGIYLSRK